MRFVCAGVNKLPNGANSIKNSYTKFILLFSHIDMAAKAPPDAPIKYLLNGPVCYSIRVGADFGS